MKKHTGLSLIMAFSLLFSVVPLPGRSLTAAAGYVQEQTTQTTVAKSYPFHTENSYIYDQLGSEAQSLYDEMYEVCSEVDTSAETYEKTPEIVYTGMDTDELRDVVYIFLYDHPEFFWLANSYSYGRTGSTRYVSIHIYDDFQDGSDRLTARDTIIETAQSYIDGALAYDTDYDRAKYLHDTLQEDITYGFGDLDQSLASAFLEKQTVCAGFTKAYRLTAAAVGVSTISVIGKVHGWNESLIGGKWYQIDVTNDLFLYSDSEIESFDSLVGYYDVTYSDGTTSQALMHDKDYSYYTDIFPDTSDAYNGDYDYITDLTEPSEDPTEAPTEEPTETDNRIEVSLDWNNPNSSRVDTVTLYDGDYLDDAYIDGYSFVGWYTEEDGGTEVYDYDDVIASGQTTFYAHWIAYTYNASQYEYFYWNDGTDKYEEADVYQYIPRDPTREGYEFLGWYTDPDGGTMLENQYDACRDSYSTYYAHWQLIEEPTETTTESGIEITLDWNNYDTSRVDTITLYEGDSLPSISLSLYYFDGWYTEEDGGTYVYDYDDVIASGQTTFYAHWVGYTTEPSQYEYFYWNDGTDKYEYVNVYSYSLPEPTRDGYEFLGWYTDPDGGTLVEDRYDAYSDDYSEYYAHWQLIEETEPTEETDTTEPTEPTEEVEEHIIIFDCDFKGEDGDSIMFAMSYDFIASDPGQYDLPDPPEREGYLFDGWYADGVQVTEITYDNSMDTPRFVAHWIEIIPDETEPSTTETTESTSSSTSTTTFTSTTTSDITSTSTSTSETTSTSTSTSETTSTSTSTSETTSTSTSTSTSTAPTTPDTEETESTTTSTTIYTIKFYYNDSSGFAGSCDYSFADGSETYGMPSVPARDGYRFVGWFTDPVAGTRITEISKDTIRYDTLFAHWEQIAETTAPESTTETSTTSTSSETETTSTSTAPATSTTPGSTSTEATSTTPESTSTEATSTTPEATSTEEPTSEPSETTPDTTEDTDTGTLMFGDVSGEGVVNASDAAELLKEAAYYGANGKNRFDKAHIQAGDINEDGVISAGDAAIVLTYAAHVGANGGTQGLRDFYRKQYT